ncbi:MAG: methyltransferase domain-containing protein [Myxococcales bacterium]|nr:methyltransferase domain-containing protein [Myxococcales bacterium]
MVRLRREIEGVRPNRAVPVPAYARDERARDAVLPAFAAAVRALPPGRTLLAGCPRPDLAAELARAGHWVTLTDLDEPQLQALHAAWPPEVLGRATLQARAYGDAAFSPSSFDHVVLADALHRYLEPAWLVRKAARELKPDGRLVLRALVCGSVADVAAAAAAEGGPWQRPAELALPGLERLARGPLAALVVGRHAQDAIARGAHLQAARFGTPWPELRAALAAAGLREDDVLVGATRSLQAADLLWDATPVARRGLVALLQRLPPAADALDAATLGARVVLVQACRALRGPSFKF